MTYALLASSEDREAWMEARRGGVTATDIARLITSPSEWAAVRAEKAGEVGFRGNKATKWGEEREPIIAAKLDEKYPGLTHNTHTIAKDGAPQYLATPDMIGRELLCQIKTAGLKPGESIWWAPPEKYAIQCQWEMWVADRETNILAVEYHRSYEPFETVFEYMIRRDDELIADLVNVADLFLAGASWVLDQRLREVAAIRAELTAVKERLEDAENMIRKEVGDHTRFAYASDVGSIKFGPVKDRETFDSKRWLADHPDGKGTYVKLSPQPPRLTINTKEE
ncbi:YqaJ-like recombinase protein [Brevibacterium sanguinis]|uniref:YqaJ-like recombinase protein n=2 Tax=Brevibacterium TaxID=1696 RepID=A0A366IMX0_9MICO|nr:MULTISPECIES: YqaJ viral recombinase family protein [Brevibacterium]RBP66378.1 YqaJ-like recombinase protein [Brevibacterium sanguinis]RBP73030.1 YqaJ-like recombinase protein [Brevibacterium celere]